MRCVGWDWFEGCQEKGWEIGIGWQNWKIRSLKFNDGMGKKDGII